MRQKHCAIRPHVPAGLGFRQGQAYDQAVADVVLAKLNIERSEVRASVSGIVTNNELRPGAYLTPGKGVMALLDTDTLHVQGYFEENKLQRIHIGDPVNVRLMGSSRALPGKVESVAAGIEDRDRSNGSTLLANVNPTSTGCGWRNVSRSGSR
ncbi:multidrug resistance efflux pump [Bradyrhizobium sp. I1.7.5]